MDIEDWTKLLNYVENCLNKNFKPDEIKEELLKNNWKEEYVDTVLNYLKSKA